MRIRLFIVSLAMVLLGAWGSQAALHRYNLRTTTLIEYNTTSPRLEILTGNPHQTASGRVMIEANKNFPNNPVLRAYRTGRGGGSGTTVNLPGLSGFIWVKGNATGGPTGPETGTGTLADTIDWGDISTWTVKGGTFCNSVPITICTTAQFEQDNTIETPVVSDRYLWHVWTFHGTGFRADAYIARTTNNTSIGNSMTITRGEVETSGQVPALPLLGIGAVGVSVIAMGMASLRKRS